MKESRAERTARAVNHARATLLAGFTTVRDLGTEGAQYDDVGLKTAITILALKKAELSIQVNLLYLKSMAFYLRANVKDFT